MGRRSSTAIIRTFGTGGAPASPRAPLAATHREIAMNAARGRRLRVGITPSGSPAGVGILGIRRASARSIAGAADAGLVEGGGEVGIAGPRPPDGVVPRGLRDHP